MNGIWLDEPPMYRCHGHGNRNEIPDITNWRRTQFSDYEKLRELSRMKTFDMFGDVDPANISENSCLSLVQVNANNEVVANISLRNYPNVLSIPPQGWLEWISHHYGMPGVTERNTLFVHMLIWDVRYNEIFLKRLLDAVFISSIHTTHVILVMPPWITPVDLIGEHMTRIIPNGITADSYRVQALYVSLRHMHCPRLKIRRVVEEDNDDIIPILERESSRFKELYGEFYISEMMRYPDGLRQLIVAEADGVVTGVLCLNETVDIQTLNRHFELGPYHGLRKPHMSDKILSENEKRVIASEILFPVSQPEKKDRFKVKTGTNISGFRLTEETDVDWFDQGEFSSLDNEDCLQFPAYRNETVCSCSDDGLACNEVLLDAPCPSSCKRSASDPHVLRTSRSVGEAANAVKEPETNSPQPAGSRIELLREKRKSISISNRKFEVRIKLDNQGSDGNVDKIGVKAEMGRLSTERASEARATLANEAPRKKLATFARDSMAGGASMTSQITDSQSIEEFDAGAFKRLSILASGSRLSTNSEEEEEEDSFDDKISPMMDLDEEIGPLGIINDEDGSDLSVYHGERNAFTLEIFSMRDDVDERLSYDYLEAVFECFPEEEYCVVLIPPSFPTFPLLQYFVRVPLRFNKDYPLVLYLAHRATVLGELRTGEAVLSDVAAVEELLFDVPKRGQVLEDFENALRIESPYSAYTFFCQGTIVGFAILCVEREVEYIRSRYNIDDYISFDNVSTDSHAQIIHLTIMPIFASLHRYFFQELMRLSDKQILYYRLYHSEVSALTRAEPLVTFLGEMIPVSPRRRLKYCLDNYPETRPADFVTQDFTQDKFALYMIIPRLTSLPKTDINVRVVVVGASDCGLSLLESLVFGPNATSVTFANLTLVSQDGIPFENRPDETEKDELTFSGRYCRDYRRLIGTRAWINVVHGTLTAINRKDKFVTVSSMGALSYDYLILTCGLQYQRPKFYEESRAERRGKLNDYQQNPVNCLTINNERDAANSVSYCNRLFAKDSNCSIILYGRNIDCYSALAMFLRSGLEGRNIILVEPVVDICEIQNASFFGNDEVEAAVSTAIKESGVTVISGWDLVDWDLERDEEDVFVTGVTLKRKNERKELSCDVLFNFKEKTISLNTFLAICRSGLVFDGSVVIDPEFRTNDPCIFAAGTITKYGRRFYADESSHKYYNLHEIGERLGQILRNIIDPRNADEEHSPGPVQSALNAVLPTFKKPIITSSRLPGNFYYLNVRKPGNSVTDDTNDLVLITGYPTASIGYFQLHFNQFDTVEAITCISKKEFEFENYITLYGKHETLLNEIKTRFQNSMISDLYAYFREPWAVALFHDRFECLRVENRATLLSPTVICGDSLMNDCVKALLKSKWDAMKPEDRQIIETRYAGSVYQEELENNFVDFLQHSEVHLPMYCNPRFLRHLLDDIETIQGDPLFPKSSSLAH